MVHYVYYVVAINMYVPYYASIRPAQHFFHTHTHGEQYSSLRITSKHAKSDALFVDQSSLEKHFKRGLIDKQISSSLLCLRELCRNQSIAYYFYIPLSSVNPS
jgi:hypothetical protein